MEDSEIKAAGPQRPNVGDIVEGTVAGIQPFGAFISFGGMSGMVHISEVANAYVKDINDFLKIGDTVKAVVLSTENNRVSLSIKRAVQPPAPVPVPTVRETGPVRNEDFEARLSRFMKDSEERQVDVRRNRDNKHKSAGRR